MSKHLFLTAMCLLLGISAKAADERVLISTKNTSLLLTAPKGGDLRFAYYGAKIEPQQTGMIYDAGDNINRPVYPTFGVNCTETAAIMVAHSDGNLSLDLAVEEIGTSSEENASVTTITLKDKVYPFFVKVFYKAYNNSDIIETWTEISHTEKKPVVLQRFDSGTMLLRRGDVWLSHLHGSWGSETYVTEEPLLPGMKTIKNMSGSHSGHGDHGEVMFSLDGKPQEHEGRVIAALLCWSGNYELRIDTDNNHSHRLLAGMNPVASEYRLEPKEVFTTPHLAFTYSDKGIGGASRNIHRWARNGMVHGGNKQRDILLNSWEGVYFDINEPGMAQMMADIASMGGELFVMDDGWFGDKYPRNNDTSSLGDWTTDHRKLPNGIGGLVAEAKKNGIKFGIWIEPESINKGSELYEKHPDWVIHQSNRPIRYGRGGTQMVLDVSNPNVQDHIFGVVDNLLTDYPEIAYIKWDMNAVIANYGSDYLPRDKQSHLYIDYHRGLHKTLQRIRAKYPDVVIQACAGGGGRVDYGVMPYFDEVWVSDNTDALQRIFIQWGTSYFYPAIAMAQHVSAAPNHQTGRSLPLKFRFDVAMSGRLGMEIQPKDMTAEEKDFARKAIADYKTIRPVVQFGELYRLVSPYDRKNIAALMYTKEDRSEAVVFAYKIEHMRNEVIPRVRLEGLDPAKIYRMHELTVADGKQPCHIDGKEISGAILMQTGLEIPLGDEYASRIFRLTAE